MAVMDGPLEPSSTTTSNVAEVPDDPSFVNFFSTAVNVGSASNAIIGGQPFRSSTMMQPSHPQGVVPPTIATIQAPPAPLSTSTPLMPLVDNPEVNNDIKLSANLVKPSTFFGPPSSSPLMMPPVSSSMPTAPPLHPPGGLQRPYGAPLLQPFPPPTPPPSLTPTAASMPNFAFITREKIREALLVLVQDDQFVDMVYRALLNTHSS